MLEDQVVRVECNRSWRVVGTRFKPGDSLTQSSAAAIDAVIVEEVVSFVDTAFTTLGMTKVLPS